MFRQLRPLQVVFDVLVALGFALVALPAELVTSAAPGTEWVAVVLVLIMAAAVAVRRLSPGLSLGVAWTGALLQMTAERNPGFVDIAIFAVLYVTAAYGSRVVFWAGLASVGVGSAAITIYLFRWGLIGQFSWSDLPSAVAILIAALFALGLAWTSGALVRNVLRGRATRAAQVRAEAETAAEQERTRIARDMHDIVAHSLAVIIAQSDGARYAAAADPAAQSAALGTISTTARSALSAASSSGSSRRSAALSPLSDEALEALSPPKTAEEPDTARTDESGSKVDWEESEHVVDWVLGAA